MNIKNSISLYLTKSQFGCEEFCLEKSLGLLSYEHSHSSLVTPKKKLIECGSCDVG